MHWIILKYSLIVSGLLYATGIVAVPWASKFGPVWENAIYLVGRVPIFYVVGLYIYHEWARNHASGNS
jgi:hypothetical protein